MQGMRSALFFILSFLKIYYLSGAHMEDGQIDKWMNDSLVVVMDKELIWGKHRGLVTKVRGIVEKITKKYLKHGTLSVSFQTTPNLSSKKGVTAVLCIASCESTWKTYNSAEEEGILFIALTDPYCPRLPSAVGITIPLIDVKSEVVQLILDMRTSEIINWKSVSVIYDRVGNTFTQKLTEVLTKPLPPNDHSCSLSLYQIDKMEFEWQKKSNVEKVLNLIPKTDGTTNFLVIVNLEMVATILDLAKSMKLTDPTMQWLFLIMDNEFHNDNITNYSSLMGDGENIAFIYNTSYYKQRCQGGLICHVTEMSRSLSIALDKSIQEEIKLADQVSEEEWEAIKPSRVDRRNSLLNYMQTKLQESGKCGNCSQWSLLTSQSWGKAYSTGNQSFDFLPVGYWTPLSGPILSDHLFPHLVHGFRRRKIPIVTFHFPPWQIIKYNETGFPKEYKGLVFEIINELARNLNFTYYVVNLSNSSAVYNKNAGNKSRFNFDERLGDVILDASAEFAAWNTSVDTIKRNKVFLGAIAFTVTEERKRFVNFTTSVTIESYALLASRPKELSRALLFVLLFTADTWFCIIGAIFVMAPLLNFAHRISPFYNHYSSRSKGGFNKMMNCFWYMYGALLQQGGAALPDADSGRLVIGTWWLVVLVIVTTYSGNLVAFLTSPMTEKVISNVDQLLERKDTVSWGMPVTSTIHTLIEKTDIPKLNILGQEAKLHKELTPRIINRIRSGEHVYIERKSSLLFIMKREFLATNRCDFSLGQEFLEEHLALAISPSSPYLKIINKEIGRMHRVGLIQKWLKDYLPKKDRCSMSGLLSGEVINHTVNIDDMQGSFFLLFFGMLSGLLIIVAEFLIKRWAKYKEENLVRPFVS